VSDTTNDSANPLLQRLGVPAYDRIRPQHVVPKDHWQAAASAGDWTLVSCVVAPGFRFEGFTLAAPGFTIPEAD